MGCSTSTQLQQQILPLPIDILNAYIDRVSIVMINKIKSKFQSQAQNYEGISFVQFVQLFSKCPIGDVRKKNLFAYCCNSSSKKLLPVSKFIEKYCIIVKSEKVHFSQIIHRLYCKTVDSDRMMIDDWDAFYDDCHEFIKKDIAIGAQRFPLPWSQFYALTQDIVNWEELQTTFHIVSIDDLPYKAFHEELERFNMEFLKKGHNYFVVPAEWFSQWLFFYEYEDTDIKNSTYRSNTSSTLLRKKSLTVKRKVSTKNRLNSSKLISASHNTPSFQPPTQITTQQIQGQFYGELKPLINVDRDITIVNEKMWSILKNTLTVRMEFERQAIDECNVDLYPVSVYLFLIDSSGWIDSDTKEIIRVRRSIRLSQFKQIIQAKSKKGKNHKETNDFIVYYKNFEQLNFTVWPQSQSLQQQVQQNPQVIITLIPLSLQQKFNQNHHRESLQLSNPTVGDKVLSYFSYQDKFVQSYILNINRIKKQLQVHFLTYSYHYERWVKQSDIKMIEQNPDSNAKQTNEKEHKKQSLFCGLVNIGNTCFLNSVVQSLASTSIFDQFFLKAKLPEKKYPLGHEFSKVVKGLLKKEDFNIQEFKKIVNAKMPLFAGYDQHDAQEFLNLLLDKMDEQLQQKPNVIDELFGGVMQSRFTCLKCSQTKTKQQKIHSISLPIPQAQYNYFTIFIFPVYSPNIHKIILRMHKNCKIIQYLNEIQHRCGISRFDLLFVEAQYSVLKKFRNELVFPVNENKKITDLGINANVQIWAYERLRNSTIDYQLKKNSENIVQIEPAKPKLAQGQFYDFYSDQEAIWGIAKVNKIKSDTLIIEFLKDNLLKQVQVKKQNNYEDLFSSLGSKVQQKVFRKIYMRKWNQKADKMIFFDCQIFIGTPKWSSYTDTLYFIEQQLKQLTKQKSGLKISRNTSKCGSYEDLAVQEALHEDQLRLTSLNSTFMAQKSLPYIVHFLEPQKNCCFFCQKQLQPFHSVEQIKPCCEPEHKDIPLLWAGKQKFFYFFVDWIDIQQYNENYFHKVQMDVQSIDAQQKMKNQQISLEQCLELWRKPQTIEMQCQKCKSNQHMLQVSIKKAPIITVFHLKEFRYTEEGHFIKLNINLQWIQSINLQKYHANDSAPKNSIYQMYSVILHKGSTSSGHYTCMAKRRNPLQKTKVWVNFDDESTEVINQKPASIQNAYLLFFKKVDIPSSAVVHFSI